jgi:hypothetical protein
MVIQRTRDLRAEISAGLCSGRSGGVGDHGLRHGVLYSRSLDRKKAQARQCGSSGVAARRGGGSSESGIGAPYGSACDIGKGRTHFFWGTSGEPVFVTRSTCAGAVEIRRPVVPDVGHEACAVGGLGTCSGSGCSQRPKDSVTDFRAASGTWCAEPAKNEVAAKGALS